MAGIQGIGGVAGPINASGEPSKRPEPVTTTDGDDVALSKEAQEALNSARLAARQDSVIREEAVARARQNIEQGTFRLQEVVLQVAARISRFVDSV